MGADGVIHNTKTRRHELRVRPTAVTRPSAHGSRLAGCTPRERGTGGGTGPRGAWSEHGARNHDLTTTQQGQPLCSRPMAPPRLWLVWHVWHICGAVCCSILFIHVPMDSTQRVLLSCRQALCIALAPGFRGGGVGSIELFTHGNKLLFLRFGLGVC